LFSFLLTFLPSFFPSFIIHYSLVPSFFHLIFILCIRISSTHVLNAAPYCNQWTSVYLLFKWSLLKPQTIILELYLQTFVTTTHVHTTQSVEPHRSNHIPVFVLGNISVKLVKFVAVMVEHIAMKRLYNRNRVSDRFPLMWLTKVFVVSYGTE
jgi:hypothetical protein